MIEQLKPKKTWKERALDGFTTSLFIMLLLAFTGWLGKIYDSSRDTQNNIGNLFSWITYMKTLVWFSRKGDNRTYCYEMAARMANEVCRWTKSKSLDQVSIYDLYENENFKPLEND